MIDLLLRLSTCVISDVVDPLESTFPPELSILRDSSPHPEPGIAARRYLPFPFPPPPVSLDLPYLRLPTSLEDRFWDSDGPEEAQGVLNVGLSVQCKDSRMVVSIDKESLNVSLDMTSPLRDLTTT